MTTSAPIVDCRTAAAAGGHSLHPVVRRFGAAGKKSEWLTPPEVLRSLGDFDLDPCAPINRPWPMAREHYTENGLTKNWQGRVWLNPPYGPKIYDWVKRLAEHGNGIALIPARTETKGFHAHVWKKAHSVFFFAGRLAFYNADGTVANGSFGAPCVLAAYGKNNTDAITASGIQGQIVYASNVADKRRESDERSLHPRG
jgi:hypothetical protein